MTCIGHHRPVPGRRRHSLARRALCTWVLVAGIDVAAATDTVEHRGDYLAKMDTDGDGRVSSAEFVAWMGYAFEQMDRDGDGVLSAAELPGGKGKPVTGEQHRQRLLARFARQDANGDGYLDARELSAPPL